MNKNRMFVQLVSFKPYRLVYENGPEEPPGKEGETGAPKTPEQKCQELKDGVQKIEQRVSDLAKKMDERSKDADFQEYFKNSKIDFKAKLQEITAKIAEIKANLDKSDADKHSAILKDIQEVLGPLEQIVENADYFKKAVSEDKADELKKFNETMEEKFPKDEAERAAAFKESKAEKAKNTAEVGKEFKLRESTNLFDNIGKKEGRIVGVLTEDTTVKIIDKKMMSVTTRGDIADATSFDKGSVHPWVKVEGKLKTGVNGKGPEKTYRGWIPLELIKPKDQQVIP